jgi:acid phosphatase (class A)
MKRQLYKYFILTAVTAVIFGVSPVSTYGQVRSPQKDHYSKLAQLDAKPQPGYANLDKMTYQLSDWGPLLSWKLFRTYYATKPLNAFPSVDVPANSSKRTRAELDYMLELQRTRTEAELEWSLKLANIYYNPTIINPADKQYASNRDNLFYLGRGMGSWFRREELPLTTDLLSKTAHDATVYILEFKLKYARPRPYTLEPALKAPQQPPHGSFPSGHSFNNYVNAELLARLAPDRREGLLAEAHAFAWSREILGVHYPSDSEAGRILASEFVRSLFENRQFVKDFEAVKLEWEQKRSK